MLQFKQWKIGDNERGLLFHDKQFQQVLLPGRHRKLDFGDRLNVDVMPIGSGEVLHAQLDVLLKQANFAACVHVQQLNTQEVGVLYCDNRLIRIVEPGERVVWWKEPFSLRIETFDIGGSYRVQDALLSEILRQGVNIGKKGDRLLQSLVPEQSVGLLYENGRLKESLGSGRHAFWQVNRQLAVQIYDLRLQNVEVSGQEILSKDRVSLRINLNAAFRIRDPKIAAQTLKQVDDHVYRRLQLALREVVGTRTLDELLADKHAVSRVSRRTARRRWHSTASSWNRSGSRTSSYPAR